MKPELIIQDFCGKHAADANGTRARLLKGGSWKRQRIIVIVPADYDQEEVGPDSKRIVIKGIPAKVYLSHVNLIFPPNNGVVRILAQGMEVGDAYSTAIEQVLAHPDLKEWEFILTIEHDNAPPQDGVLKLIEGLEQHPEYGAISGSYFTKGEGGVWQGWGDPNDPLLNFRPQVPRPGTIQEVCGLGMGFCLFRLSIFKDARLRKPWFETKKGVGGVGTQDLAFWTDARKYGYRAAVDTTVTVGHYDAATGTMW